MNGTKPGADNVIRFARGFGLDVREALQIAGFDPAKFVGTDDEVSASASTASASTAPPSQRLAEGLAALSQRYQTVTWESQGGNENLSDEQVTELLAWIEERLQREEERKGK